MRFAFFDTKDYDKASFEKTNSDIEFKFLEPRLTEDLSLIHI